MTTEQTNDNLDLESFNPKNASKDELDKVASSVVEALTMIDLNNIVKLDKDSSLYLFELILEKLEPICQLYSQMNGELDKQVNDLTHIMYESRVTGKNITSQPEISQSLEDATVLRRSIKDASSAIHYVATQLRNCRSFINSMDNRIYTPKSKKYSDVGILRADSMELDESYLLHLREQYEQLVLLVKDSSTTKETHTRTTVNIPKTIDGLPDGTIV